MEMYFVVPFVKEIIARLPSSDYIIRTDDVTLLEQIDAYAKSGNQCPKHIKLDLKDDAQLDVCMNYPHLPLTIILRRARRLPQKYPFRILLDGRYDENYKICQASIANGNNCGIYLETGADINWNLLGDLYDFSIEHNFPLEPFHSILEGPGRNRLHHVQRSYFDDSESFIHVDTKGDYAFSMGDLQNNRTAGNIYDQHWTETLKTNQRQKITDSYTYFLDNHKCAACESWRMCKGEFYPNDDCLCRQLFRSVIQFKNDQIEKLQ